MASCLDIITYALRMSRIIGAGKTPKAAEATEGMIALQSLYDQWRTGGMFGELEDIYLEGDDIAEEGKRYFVPTGLTLTAATSVYLDSDEVTRQPRDLALYESLTQAGVQTARLYDRTAWVDLLGLEQSDTAPLSSRNAYGLAAALATSGGFIAMFDDAQISPRVERLAANFTRSLMSKQGSTQNETTGTYY
jgi:hypothetical protein